MAAPAGPACGHLQTDLAERIPPGAPGVVFGASRQGEILALEAMGQASLELAVPLSPDAVMHAGSVAKPFTAYAVLRLAQDGRLSLDDPVGHHLTDLPAYIAPLTLRQLLQHTSGLRDYWALSALAGQHGGDRRSQAAALALLRRQQALNFPPGSRHLYSNSGYLLLAEVIAAASGQSYANWMAGQVFLPLGMGDSRMQYDPFEIVPGLVPSYRRAGDEGAALHRYLREPLNSGVVGSGNLVTSVRDLLRFGEHLLATGIDGAPVLSLMAEQPELPPALPSPGYGLGISVGSYRGREVFHHGGANAGYRAHLLLFPSDPLVIAVLANAGHLRAAAIAEQLADCLLPAQDQGAEARDLAGIVEESPAIPSAPPQGHEEFLGMYLMDNGLLLRVRELRGQALMLLGGAPHALSWQGGDAYALSGEQGRLAFRRARDGRIEAVSLELPEGRLEGEPRPRLALPPRELREYLGDWFSAELLSGVTLADDGAGGLRLEQPTGGRLALAPLQRNVFVEWDSADFIVVFERDRRGRPRAFTVSVERARDVRFERLRQ